MKYTIDKCKNIYIVKKNNVPVYLKGVGTLIFFTREEAEGYIQRVIEAAYYISQGVPE